PQVVVVEPLYGRNSDHPPEHPAAGQIFLSSIYDALAKGPQWARSLMMVTYDEHGGFFDHVPPPKAPDERAAAGFDQLGFRVPSLVLGPWVKQGGVSHTIYDHTSMLATIERHFGLEPLTVRDASANDLFDCLDLDRVRRGDPAAPA